MASGPAVPLASGSCRRKTESSLVIADVETLEQSTTSGPPSPRESLNYVNIGMRRSVSSDDVAGDVTDGGFINRLTQRSHIWTNGGTVDRRNASTRSAASVEPSSKTSILYATDDSQRNQRTSDASFATATNGLSAASDPSEDLHSNNVESKPRISRGSRFQTTIRQRGNKLSSAKSNSSSLASCESNGSLDSLGYSSSNSMRENIFMPNCAAPKVDSLDHLFVASGIGDHGSLMRNDPQTRSGFCSYSGDDDQLPMTTPGVRVLRRYTGSDDSWSTDDGGSSDGPMSMMSQSLNDTDEYADESISTASLSPDQPIAQDKLYRVVDELVTTEKRYVSRLHVLHEVKIEIAAMLGPDTAKSMFQNIDVIHQFHKDNFLPKLEQRLSSWAQYRKLGDIMINSVPFLKLYTDYVTNLNAASQLVESFVEKNKKFATFVKSFKDDANHGRLTLQAYMLEPIQRVPRYELLLREYLKKLPPESEDASNISKAIEDISSIGSHFEVMLLRDANMSELMQIQKQLLGFRLIVSHDRRLVRRGHVFTVNLANKRSERFAFLFNDMLLICIERPMMSKYQVKHQLMMEQVKVTTGFDSAVPYSFNIKCHKKSVELAFRSADEKIQWEQDILDQIKEMTKKKLNRQFENEEPEVQITRYAAYDFGHAPPVFSPKESATQCRQCQRVFTKDTHKHYCRACGHIFCRKCASQSAVLEYNRQKSQRVCDLCFVHVSSHMLNSPSIDASPLLQTAQAPFSDIIAAQDYLKLSADGVSWLQRWIVVYESGILHVYRSNQDSTPLAGLSLSTSQYAVNMIYIDKPQNQAINIASCEKSYILHSDQQSTIALWYDALRRVSYQLSRPTLV